MKPITFGLLLVFALMLFVTLFPVLASGSKGTPDQPKPQATRNPVTGGGPFLTSVEHDGHRWVVCYRNTGYDGGVAIAHHPDCKCQSR